MNRSTFAVATFTAIRSTRLFPRQRLFKRPIMTQSYIVRFNDATSDEDYNKAKDDIKSQGGNIKHEYVLFKGFTAEIPDSDVSTLSTLESHPHVESVEKDQEVHIQGSS